MIEINLLPQEYRVGNQTNFALVLTLAVGVVVVGGAFLWLASVSKEVTQREQMKNELTERQTELQNEANKVKKIKEEINRQKARQDTIIQISQSKVMWSLKLVQFSDIMGQFTQFWLDSLTLTRSNRGGGMVSLAMNATGRDMRDVAKFRDTIKNDPNFAYHFSEMEGDTVTINSLGGRYSNATEKMVFRIQLPLDLEPKD